MCSYKIDRDNQRQTKNSNIWLYMWYNKNITKSIIMFCLVKVQYQSTWYWFIFVFKCLKDQIAICSMEVYELCFWIIIIIIIVISVKMH